MYIFSDDILDNKLDRIHQIVDFFIHTKMLPEDKKLEVVKDLLDDGRAIINLEFAGLSMDVAVVVE